MVNFTHKDVNTLITVGIVAEYNPFHNGHKLHIEKAKELTGADRVIVVMSGNFVQRGEPAIFDKWSRTKSALLHGADVVIELPVYFSTASAEYFAKAAVDILDKTGCVDYICFGSESGDISAITKAAESLLNESDEFKKALKANLDKGLPYPAARSKALSETEEINEDILSSPNNILAVEYVKALLSLNSSIKPVTLKRQFTDYNSTETVKDFASATALRCMLKAKEDISAYVPCLPDTHPVCCDTMSHYLSYKMRILGKDGLSQILDIGEGLENRILEACGRYYEYDFLVSYVKTKRFTHSRIQRIFIHALLDITKADFENIISSGMNNHIRILGFRKDAQDIVSAISKNASVPVVTTVKSREGLNDTALFMLEKERIATDIYYLLKGEDISLNKDLTTSMVLI